MIFFIIFGLYSVTLQTDLSCNFASIMQKKNFDTVWRPLYIDYFEF